MEAIQVLRMLGADAVAHRARLLNKKLLEEASRIFAMTASHADAVIALDYGAASKLAVLGVSDPVGMDLKAYQTALGEIRERLGKFLPWLTA
jgi:protein-tyrosine-phosphatase